MTYRDRQDAKNSTKAILKENLPLYYRLKSIDRFLTIAAIVLLIVTAVMFFVSSHSVVTILLMLDSILLIITGNIIAHYKLLRK